jgi:hypothetical protein
MMKHNEMQKTVIKSVSKTTDDATYVYTLFYEQSRRVASFGIPLYSITVEMVSKTGRTEHTVKEIFADIGKANVFFNMLAENLATPRDLPYILEDSITV